MVHGLGIAHYVYTVLLHYFARLFTFFTFFSLYCHWSCFNTVVHVYGDNEGIVFYSGKKSAGV